MEVIEELSDQTPQESEDLAVGGKWSDKAAFIIAGPNGYSIQPKGTEYPKPAAMKSKEGEHAEAPRMDEETKEQFAAVSKAIEELSAEVKKLNKPAEPAEPAETPSETPAEDPASDPAKEIEELKAKIKEQEKEIEKLSTPVSKTEPSSEPAEELSVGKSAAERIIAEWGRP